MTPDTRRRFWSLLAPGVLLVLVAGVSFTRAARVRYDFDHFYLDAQYLWQHGELNPDLDNPDATLRRQLPFYLPVVSLMLVPIAVGGPVVGAALWTLMHLVCLAYTLRVIWRWIETESPRDGPAPLLGVVCVLMLPAVYEAARFSQLSFVVLALVLGTVAFLEARRPIRAGMLIGIVSVVKLLPAVLVLWLVLKRQWAALGAFVVTVAVLVVAPPVIAWGVDRTVEYHQQWWQHNVEGVLSEGMVAEGRVGHFVDHRNQSIRAVLGRLLDPQHPYRAPVAFGSLSEAAVGRLAAGAVLVMLAALAWTTRKRWRNLSERGRRAEAAMYLIAMLVFAPLLRQYYLVWAFPAVALLACAAAEPMASRQRTVGWVGLIVWLLGLAAWLSPTVRAYGAHLVVLVVLGVLLACLERQERQPGLGEKQ